MGMAREATQLWGQNTYSCGYQICDCSWVQNPEVCNRGAYATVCGRCCCDALTEVYYTTVVHERHPVIDNTRWYVLAAVLAALVIGGILALCYFKYRKPSAPAFTLPPLPEKEERGCCGGGPCCTMPCSGR